MEHVLSPLTPGTVALLNITKSVFFFAFRQLTADEFTKTFTQYDDAIEHTLHNSIRQPYQIKNVPNKRTLPCYHILRI